jgi:polysaccharide deacetylase family protein (PEP-CTERM system associated)
VNRPFEADSETRGVGYYSEVSDEQVRSILSVDVEDYFQVEAFTDVVSRDSWDSWPGRVEANTHRVLDLFDETGVKATFFTLGWVAERQPALVREIVRRGHELACHSYWHRLIYTLTPDEFREDTQRAKNVLEQTSGERVLGYRAPSYSVTERSLWALDVLQELGFEYDSSIFPIRHDVYGIPTAPRTPFRAKTASGASIIEYPITTFRLFGMTTNFPVGGGGYLRIFPYLYTWYGVRQAWKQGLPLITYIHPWEVDPDQPRMPGRLSSRLRHYTNLARTAARMRKLIASTRFVPFRDSGVTLQNTTPVDLSSGTRPGEPPIMSYHTTSEER